MSKSFRDRKYICQVRTLALQPFGIEGGRKHDVNCEAKASTRWDQVLGSDVSEVKVALAQGRPHLHLVPADLFVVPLRLLYICESLTSSAVADFLSDRSTHC